MTTIEDTFGERMTLTRAAEYIGIDRRQLKKVYRSFGGFDLGTGRLVFFNVYTRNRRCKTRMLKQKNQHRTSGPTLIGSALVSK